VRAHVRAQDDAINNRGSATVGHRKGFFFREICQPVTENVDL